MIRAALQAPGGVYAVPRLKSHCLIAPLVLLALSACGKGDADKNMTDQDPVVADAVNDPIMADPDLTAQNRGNAALTGGGPASAQIPPFDSSIEERERARGAAADLMGGRIEVAPMPQRSAEASRLAGAETPLAVASALKLIGPGCEKRFVFSAGWAAKLPAPLAIYPRGHTLIAGGSDGAPCQIRSVRFVTPVATNEVIDFYFATASKAGLSPQHALEGTDDVVIGGRGIRKFSVYARKRADDLTEVDLVTAGF